MAYSNTTPVLGLPQWEGTDPPERTDYNDAFSAVDGVVSALVDLDEYQAARPALEETLALLWADAGQLRQYTRQF